MLAHGLPRVHAPPIQVANPFLIRLHMIEKDAMRRTLMYQFGMEFTTFVMNLNVPFAYPVVTYGEEWVCTVFILYQREMDQDLNLPPIPTVTLRSEMSIRVMVRKKEAGRAMFLRKFGEERCNEIFSSAQPLILVGYPHEELTILIFVQMIRMLSIRPGNACDTPFIQIS